MNKNCYYVNISVFTLLRKVQRISKNDLSNALTGQILLPTTTHEFDNQGTIFLE